MIQHNTQYFESILQLRPFNQEVLDYVIKKIKENGTVFISKEIQLKTGIDLYLSSNRFAIALGKMLRKRFKGTVKLSRSLYSRDKQTTKLLYRVTVCFRLQKDL
ncbi:MAG: NMD3-related protein [archaeon]